MCLSCKDMTRQVVWRCRDCNFCVLCIYSEPRAARFRPAS